MTFPTTHPALARALASRDYTVPTDVQLAVLQAPVLGRDLLVSAQTGSGKTVAFGLAMASQVLGDAERLEPASLPRALIIAPTRELALQVQRELNWLYAETGARVVTCVGGMDVRAEARALHAGAHIVVGTPGRLRDHLERKRLDLSELKSIVLDEADEMLDLGFREDLEIILEATPADRQTLLFSATMPREIEMLAQRYQNDSARIETLRRDQQHADIEYQAMRVGPSDVENAVVNVLRYHEARATLVFCSTREAVKRLHGRLVERGFSAVALSGELTQHERTHALQAVRDGRARVLVATDVAARGLDLPDLALVIHADLPNDRETLLHRSGRTGRAGKKGLCTLIVPYNRRRKAETLLAAAKIKATWGPPPTVEAIRALDHDRFLAADVFTVPASDEDRAQIEQLQASRSADEIALALIRMHREQLPSPEDLPEDSGPPPRREFGRDRDDKFKPDRGASGRNFGHGDRVSSRDVSAEAPAHRKGASSRRDDSREMVWFKLNIGRDRNADPRWLLPLICNAGGVTKSDIGAIKISDRETRFQIVATLAEPFEKSARTMKQKEGHISRADGPPAHSDDSGARANTRPMGHSDKPWQKRPHRNSHAAPTSGRDGGSGYDERGKAKPWQSRKTGGERPSPQDKTYTSDKPATGDARAGDTATRFKPAFKSGKTSSAKYAGKKRQRPAPSRST